ncbi:MAG TPA: hypothetical protein VIG40_08955 [Tissierellaceae bacterium]
MVYDWEKLEKQPLYVKTVRSENKKQQWKIELAVDRTSEDDSLRGEVFFVYGQGIQDVPENSDVELVINKELSTFMRQDYGFMPYIVVESVKKKNN